MPESSVSFTVSKKKIVVLAGILATCFAVWHFVISPRMQLDELAQETCDRLDGSIMLVAGATLGSSIKKAERLGFSGPELGDRMRDKCPSIMQQLSDFSSRQE